MSIPIVIPERMALATFAYNFPNWSNTTPFTYQDGMTNAKLVESLIWYIDNTLIPGIDSEMQAVIDAWKVTVLEILAAFDEAVEDIIDSSIELQDPVMKGIIENLSSQTRILLDELYYAKDSSKIIADVSTVGELQAALDKAFSEGKEAQISGTVTTDQTVIVKVNADLARLTLIHTGNVPAVSIPVSNVAIDGLTIVGPGNTAQVHLSRGIYALGAVGAELQNITVKNCTISGFKMMGVSLEFVDRFDVSDNDISDVNYAGVHCFSTYNGVVSRNNIRHITGTPLAYGITINKAVASLTVAPRSHDVLVSENIVSDIPNWEGLDTHGGERITFINNTVTGCRTGIAVVAARESATGLDMFAPKDCVVNGNVIDYLKTDGTGDFGISFAGARSAIAGTPTEYATGVISNNVVRNHGDATQDNRGVFYLRTSRGLIVSGNRIVNAGSIGINMLTENDDMIVSANTVTEVWCTTSTRCIAIAMRDLYNYATVIGNRHSVNNEHISATLVNVMGYSTVQTANNEVMLIGNDFTSCATPFAGSTSTPRIQFMTSAPVAKAAALSTLNTSTVDATYGTEEMNVINNTRARVNGIEAALQALGLLS